MFNERIHIGNLKEADVRSFYVISHINVLHILNVFSHEDNTEMS